MNKQAKISVVDIPVDTPRLKVERELNEWIASGRDLIATQVAVEPERGVRCVRYIFRDRMPP